MNPNAQTETADELDSGMTITLPRSATAPMRALEAAARRVGSLPDLPEQHRAVAMYTVLGQAWYGVCTGIPGAEKDGLPGELAAMAIGHFAASVLSLIEDEREYEMVARQILSCMLNRDQQRMMRVAGAFLRGESEPEGRA